jgi:acetylglutamate kinase
MKSLTVVKFGGSLNKNAQTQAEFLMELADVSRGYKFILVHGGGPEISAMLSKFSIESKFVNGLRYTDKNTLSVVELALSGKVNRDITSGLIRNGANAVGISGKDGSSIICKQIENLGYVGEPVKMNKKLIKILLDAGFLPVVASIAQDAEGNVMNVNADTLASFIASEFKAEKLVFLTDVPGVLDKDKNVIDEIKIKDAEALIKFGVITGGMIPKIKGCINSIKEGVGEVWIADGASGIRNIKGTVIKK